MSQPRPIFIAGPTAVGKSEIALRVAQQLGAEIVSVDSMQVYRGMDIGTAKPSESERRAVPHHLLDIVDFNETFDAARFANVARAAIEEIRSRNRIPILVGGTGLYFKAIIDGVGNAPAPDPAMRLEIESTPLADLLAELQRLDPAFYEQIDKRNPRRVFRAIEVIRQSGRPFSEQRSDWRKSSAANQTETAGAAFVLSRSTDDLRRRIDIRVDEMFRLGLVEETKELLACGLADNRTAMQALGYRQVVEHLEGKRSLPETVELVKVRTRQYARRQLTWFRRYLSGEWIHLMPATTPADAATKVVASNASISRV